MSDRIAFASRTALPMSMLHWLAISLGASFIISFSIYNTNYNLYSACNFVFEFTPGGVVMPRAQFKVTQARVR